MPSSRYSLKMLSMWPVSWTKTRLRVPPALGEEGGRTQSGEGAAGVFRSCSPAARRGVQNSMKFSEIHFVCGSKRAGPRTVLSVGGTQCGAFANRRLSHPGPAWRRSGLWAVGCLHAPSAQREGAVGVATASALRAGQGLWDMESLGQHRTGPAP